MREAGEQRATQRWFACETAASRAAIDLDLGFGFGFGCEFECDFDFDFDGDSDDDDGGGGGDIGDAAAAATGVAAADEGDRDDDAVVVAAVAVDAAPGRPWTTSNRTRCFCPWHPCCANATRRCAWCGAWRELLLPLC